MKEIIADIGWPAISKVGRESSGHAWLLVQHADLEPEFQKHCLKLMKSCPPGEVDPVNIAYLEDRLLCAAGEPQLYGTQFFRKGKDAPYEPYPIANPETVNERRAALGLEPLEAYAAHIQAKYSRPV